MPIVKVFTNVPQAKVPADFAQKLSVLTAKITNKPESFVQTLVVSGQQLCFAGRTDPTACVDFISIGGFRNKNAAATELNKCISETLKIEEDRIYIQLKNITANELARDGLTFG